ncbi:MAG: TonB-dependent receptor [Desulfobacterales bacterium]|nr:TonB-dependent receptor [Desulfobacterales bacterium]
MKKKYYHLIIFILFINSLCCKHSYAESEEKKYTLDAIVVTSKKTEDKFQTGDVDKFQTPIFYSVIGKEEFEGKIEDISQIIDKEAGIQVRQSGGLGSFSTISLRGSSSDQVMIFLDGILINDASGGGLDLSNISLADIESIEIYKGMTPINLGKASIGGAINIKTLKQQSGLNANVHAGYGSFNTYQIGTFLNNKVENLDYLMSLDYLASENDFKITNDNGTQWNKTDDTTEKRNNAEFDQKNFLGKLGYDFSDNFRIDLMNQWFSKKQDLPSWDNSESTNTSLDTNRNITTLKLTLDNIGKNINTATQFTHLWKKEEYDDKEGHVGLGQQNFEYITHRYDGNFFMEMLGDFNIASFLFDASYESYFPKDITKSISLNKSIRNSFSLGIQDSILLFNEKFIVTPACRYNYINDEMKSSVSIWGLVIEEKTKHQDYFSPQIGVKYMPTNSIVMKANAAKYTREPSFFELFGDRGFLVGNIDLKHEKGLNYDAGAEFIFQPESPLFQKISISSVYYKSIVDDLITRVYDSRGIGKSVNISESDIDGIEFAVNINFLEYFKAIFNVTWQDTENKSKIKVFNGKKLPGRFETAYAGRIEAKYKGFKIYTEYLSEQGIYYDSANLLKADDKKEINSGISWLFKKLLMTFEAKNLGDNKYEDFNGYPLPGIAYYCTAKYNF